MTRKLWIHIGTPKTGSTAIQRYARYRRPYLESCSIDFLSRGRRSSYNDLGVALRQGYRDKALRSGAEISARLAESQAEQIVLTSEMFTGGDPALLREALALSEAFDVRIVGYFRRQDKYFESNYKQKLKTGKTRIGFENYLKKFGTKAGEYTRIIEEWEAAWPDAEFIFRRFEPSMFPNGDVVYDFMGLLGLDIEKDGKPPATERHNPTPSIDVLQLMQIVAATSGLDARSVFRTMPVQKLPRFKGAVMDNEAALQLLTQFSEGNEILRKRFAPDEKVLFATDDLRLPTPEIAEPSFTDEQVQLISELLQAVAKKRSD